jgi:hypothetical protein
MLQSLRELARWKRLKRWKRWKRWNRIDGKVVDTAITRTRGPVVRERTDSGKVEEDWAFFVIINARGIQGIGVTGRRCFAPC